MSVKGYDAQVMVHRLTEVAKDTANTMRRPEVQHDHMAVQIKTDSQEKQGTVETVEKSENQAINPDAESADPGYQQAPQQEKSDLDELFPGDPPHRMDVMA